MNILLNFKGDATRPHVIDEEHFNKLKRLGFLWEFYPDAPDVFPRKDKCINNII